MANLLTTQILVDGPRNTVIKVAGVLDTSDLAQTIIVQPSTLWQSNNKDIVNTKARIKQITYNVEDTLSVNLFWDATTPLLIEELVGRGKMDYHHYGGLVNNAGAGVTGNILLATQGWAASALLSFTCMIELIKQN